MIFDVLAEEGWIGEAKTVTDLLDAEVGLLQIVSDVFQNMFRNPLISSPA